MLPPDININPSDINPSGLIFAAPHSNSGKTTICLALLRLLAQRQIASCAYKIGPDYIDPGFHTQALTYHSPPSQPCYNLDSWAMPLPLLQDLIFQSAQTDSSAILCVEGVMGLFDGTLTADNKQCPETKNSLSLPPLAPGSSAELAALTGWPVILIVSARHQAQSLAAVVYGFMHYHPHVRISALLINNIASQRHQQLISSALAHLNIPVLGYLPTMPDMRLPERHLGLYPSHEIENLSHYLDQSAHWFAENCDIEALLALARPTLLSPARETYPSAPPLGQHIAIARDAAFCFCYPHWCTQWRQQGRKLSFFSPLQDEVPPKTADAVFLPGGYPELHAPVLSAGRKWQAAIHQLAQQGAWIYGECGGYMALGKMLECAAGQHWPMLNLLPVHTSFRHRQRHLGYRHIHLGSDNTPFSNITPYWRGHEFHYATLLPCDAPSSMRPFAYSTTASLTEEQTHGYQNGRVLGSFLHLIAPDISHLSSNSTSTAFTSSAPLTRRKLLS